jgi:hypothetical protein
VNSVAADFTQLSWTVAYITAPPHMPLALRLVSSSDEWCAACAGSGQVRGITGTGRSVEYLTLPDAVRRMVTGVPQIIRGGRFFDKDGERVVGNKAVAYKPNGTRLLYADAAKEENNA